MCASTLRQLARRHDALRRRLSRAEEEADQLAMDLLQLAEEQDSRRAEADDRGRQSGAASRRAREVRDVLRRTADTGVSRLVIIGRADGSAEVQIDDGKQFTLSPALVDLLDVLASKRDGDDADGFASWKTLDEIARLLEKRSGRRMTTHAVTQQIHRLRRELFERGAVNPWVVQTNRRLGARFAVRSRG